MSAPGRPLSLVPLGVLLPLRDEVLIKGTGRTSPLFDNDDAPGAIHCAALALLAGGTDSVVIACATMIPSEYEGQPAWQLRGMAVAPAWQRHGLGTRLMHYAEELARAADPARTIIWCNARLAAIPFYERHGWRLDSDPFEIALVGTHRRMSRQMHT